MGKYYKIIAKNYDEEGNFLSETDFDEFSNYMLLPFITNVLDQREDSATFDRRLEPIGQLASEIRKKIHLIKQESLLFSKNVEQQYSSLIIDKDEFISNGLLINNLK